MSIFKKIFGKKENVSKINGDKNVVIQTNNELVRVKAKANFTLAKEYRKVKNGEIFEISQQRADELEKKGFIKKM